MRYIFFLNKIYLGQSNVPKILEVTKKNKQIQHPLLNILVSYWVKTDQLRNRISCARALPVAFFSTPNWYTFVQESDLTLPTVLPEKAPGFTVRAINNEMAVA